jgi:hypothetical protein
MRERVTERLSHRGHSWKRDLPSASELRSLEPKESSSAVAAGMDSIELTAWRGLNGDPEPRNSAGSLNRSSEQIPYLSILGRLGRRSEVKFSPQLNLVASLWGAHLGYLEVAALAG